MMAGLNMWPDPQAAWEQEIAPGPCGVGYPAPNRRAGIFSDFQGQDFGNGVVRVNRFSAGGTGRMGVVAIMVSF